MAKNSIGRIWKRIVNRYEQDAGTDCCETDLEEVSANPSEIESESCCE